VMYESRGYLINPGLNLIHALKVISLKSLSIVPRSMELLFVAESGNSMS
jgi:hypothetical protein